MREHEPRRPRDDDRATRLREAARSVTLPLPGGPRKLCGRWGPMIVGVSSDAPAWVQREWLDGRPDERR